MALEVVKTVTLVNGAGARVGTPFIAVYNARLDIKQHLLPYKGMRK